MAYDWIDAYPGAMNQVNYIRNWDPQRVYASEPCDQLREYMRDRIAREQITNVKVLDGQVLCLPYEDDTFDVVLSGHVVGDFYEEEIAELSRITKDGGWLVICHGDDEFKCTAPNPELTSRGFEWFVHESCEGGIIYDYCKRVIKNFHLVPMTRELCHTFYRDYEEDPAARPLTEVERPYYQYNPAQVDRYFEEQQDPTRVCFSILKDDRPIGEIKLKYIDRDKKECSMGIHLLNDSVKNQGYGTLAERLALRYAFEVLGMSAVNADARHHNLRSQHVLEKVGFRYTCQDENFRYYRCSRS